MRSIIRNIASIFTLFTLVGCDNFLGIGEEVDVRVTAEANVDANIVSITIENQDSDTVYYHGVDLERRGQDEWYPFGPPSIDLGISRPIGPGEHFTLNRPIITDYDPTTIPSGEYRFKVSISAVGEPGEAETKTSNAVEVSYSYAAR